MHSAIEEIDKTNPDLVFRYTDAFGTRRVEPLDQIEEKNQCFFVTAFKDYAIRALNASKSTTYLSQLTSKIKNAVKSGRVSKCKRACPFYHSTTTLMTI